MRRFCTTLVLVSSLLVATVPANAKSTLSHRQQVNAGAAQTHVKAKRVDGARTGTRVQKFTYGRT